MLKVETHNAWAANTMTMVDEDNIYLRLSRDGVVVWYITDSDANFVPLMDVSDLNVTWSRRGGIPYEDIQTVSG